MTHFAALLHELARRGFTTYTRLARVYPEHTYQGFTQAVMKAKRLGIVRREKAQIVAQGDCPCCGQRLGKDEG